MFHFLIEYVSSMIFQSLNSKITCYNILLQNRATKDYHQLYILMLITNRNIPYICSDIPQVSACQRLSFIDKSCSYVSSYPFLWRYSMECRNIPEVYTTTFSNACLPFWSSLTFANIR